MHLRQKEDYAGDEGNLFEDGDDLQEEVVVAIFARVCKPLTSQQLMLYHRATRPTNAGELQTRLS